jgi:transposase
VFAHKQLRPAQAVLLLRGVCKGESTASLVRELHLAYGTVHGVRKHLQANAAHLQPTTPVPDKEIETDKMFQNAGKKGMRHPDPADPPRRRANKRRGHGTYANDRPPVVGTVGRESGQVRLRVVQRTDSHTLKHHIEQFTRPQAHLYTDEWRGYDHVERSRTTVKHGAYEWARDDDRDGVREVHSNTAEGLWTTVRNFLRPFRGVHKQYLCHYVAICEFHINLSRVSPRFIAALVTKRTEFRDEPKIFVVCFRLPAADDFTTMAPLSDMAAPAAPTIPRCQCSRAVTHDHPHSAPFTVLYPCLSVPRKTK